MHADAHAEEAIDPAHPLGVALGEIVVDGDDMHALAGERVQIDRERGDERLAFAGAHLGDAAFVQHHAADELHVEMALAQRALGRLAHGGEGGHQKFVERLAGGQPVAELAVRFFSSSSLRASSCGSSALIALTFGA